MTKEQLRNLVRESVFSYKVEQIIMDAVEQFEKHLLEEYAKQKEEDKMTKKQLVDFMTSLRNEIRMPILYSNMDAIAEQYLERHPTPQVQGLPTETELKTFLLAFMDKKQDYKYSSTLFAKAMLDYLHNQHPTPQGQDELKDEAWEHFPEDNHLHASMRSVWRERLKNNTAPQQGSEGLREALIVIGEIHKEWSKNKLGEGTMQEAYEFYKANIHLLESQHLTPQQGSEAVASLAEKKYQTFTRYQLVEFGNYLLSDERRKLYQQGGDQTVLQERLSVVNHADVENYIDSLRRETESLNPELT